YWWIELGGENNSIADTERLRDELLGITLGVWDHIKNHCPECSERTANWALDWLQFLPAKRESRRYIGDHVLNQGDITSGGNFPDLVAYGGWSMDDHHPAGFRAVKLSKPATIFHHVPPLYGIPYRSLYSRNIDNLMFAGRDASCTHAASSSTRVMGTGCSMGQAVGVAAALAVQEGITPREVGAQIATVQQLLIADDCYLPGLLRERTALTLQAQLTATQGDPEPVRDGVNRQVGDDPHCWVAHPGDALTYTFAPQYVGEAVLILDSAMASTIAMSWHQPDDQLTDIPPQMPKCFHVEVDRGNGWELLHHVTEHYQRHTRIPIGETVQGVRYTLEETWGAIESRVYAFYLEG
ncbi:MAG: FAD-dependent oxidoreductase, partial [bacterium]